MSRRATGKTTIYSIPGIDISYLKGNGAIVPTSKTGYKTLRTTLRF